jgi:hypothetical protein
VQREKVPKREADPARRLRAVRLSSEEHAGHADPGDECRKEWPGRVVRARLVSTAPADASPAGERAEAIGLMCLKINGGIICGLRRTKPKYCACGRPADFECDWKVSARKSGTCDAPICSAHAKQVGPGKHLCPLHQRQYDDWKRRHPDADPQHGQQKSLFEEAA